MSNGGSGSSAFKWFLIIWGIVLTIVLALTVKWALDTARWEGRMKRAVEALEVAHNTNVDKLGARLNALDNQGWVRTDPQPGDWPPPDPDNWP
jgi:hypothetical protein